MSCHFFAVFVKMKDSRCAEEFVSASPILMGRIRTLDVLGSFGQKMSAIFFRTIWAQAMLQNENTITAFTFVASSLLVAGRNLYWYLLIDCRPDGHTLPTLGNFADIPYLKEQSFLHRIRDVCTLQVGA